MPTKFGIPLSFWNLLSPRENSIQIPIIQRDYAQGRQDKSIIRQRFLSKIKETLDSDNADAQLELDFIYGSEKTTTQGSKIIFPLDGQQRLTTLWLLHWYLALRAGKLREVQDTLIKFTYETRISSREFCSQLCKAQNFDNYYPESGDNLLEYIHNSKWFFTFWKQDPTIQAMLNMLDSKNIEKDCIVAVFNENFEGYWRKLTSNPSPIVFYYLTLEEFDLSDDLYIKMNARGKALTAFENFKADLIDYIQRQAEFSKNGEWNDIAHPTFGIPIKLDTDWINILWKDCNSPDSVDRIYNSFLNRFFFNELLLEIKESEVDKELPQHPFIINDKENTYQKLDPYKFSNDRIPLKIFKDLETVFCNYKSFIDTPNESADIWGIPPWFDSKSFSFIPKFENGISTELTQIQRVVFFSVCKYFKQGIYSSVSFRRWMRVIWNLVSGFDENGLAEIRTYTRVQEAIRHIDELDSHRVYESLQGKKNQKPSAFGARWNEEIEKANQILTGDREMPRDDGQTWEDVINSAEQWSFFKGSIRFLYRNNKGIANWSEFDIKFKWAKTYFKDINKASTSRNDSVMSVDYDDATLLKALISRFDVCNYINVLWWNKKTFNNRASTWLYYLLNENILNPIHELLTGNTDIKGVNKGESFEERELYLLTQTKLLDFILENGLHNSWIRHYHCHRAIYPSSIGIFLNADTRNKLLTSKHITLDKKDGDLPVIVDRNEETKTVLLYGSDIDFFHDSYPGNKFRWERDDYIYLLENDQDQRKIKNPNEQDGDKKYFRFLAENEMEEESFKQKLNNLVQLVDEL